MEKIERTAGPQKAHVSFREQEERVTVERSGTLTLTLTLQNHFSGFAELAAVHAGVFDD